ncbi:MAG: ATP-grasp domain-containing protein [Calditrichia bacterium]
MKIALTYSSKQGLLQEYKRYRGNKFHEAEIPADFFAEGDSPETIKAVMEALRSNGHNVVGIEANDAVEANLIKHGPELVFNMAEGLFGDFRESKVPIICEQLGIPYTGSDPLTLAICLNKARAKEVLSYYLIPTPAFRVFYPLQEINVEEVEFPAIVKPVSEGSSKGIFNDSVVLNATDAKKKIREKIQRYNQPVMIERFLTGDEYTVAIWGNGDDIEILPVVAINYQNLPEGAQPIYSYEAKWIWDTPQQPLEIFQCPATLESIRQERIEDVVRDTYQVMGIRDWCRVDVRMDDQGIPHILELNPLPGILPKPEDNSCFPKAAHTAGYHYADMLNRVLEFAAKRYGLPL